MPDILSNAKSETQLAHIKKIANGEPLQINSNIQGSQSQAKLEGDTASTKYNTLHHTSGNFTFHLILLGDLLGDRSAYNFEGSTSNLLKLIDMQ
jgi:hypothetical protein